MLSIPILQLLVTCVAGAALFVLLRKTRSDDPVTAAIITLGFLGRAIVGQVLFWISYLQLPIARGLQEGNGFWFYGGDSMSYFRNATAAAASGLDRIINYQNVVPSPFWVQVLATFILLMGASAAVGLFLNCLAYATSCAIANWLAPQPTFLTRAAMAAFAFSPGGVLWGTQPLKDVFFYFLMFAFVGSAAAWRRTVPAERRPWVRAAAWTLIIAFVIYGISGIRWYVGLISFLAAAMFFAATVIWTRPRLVAMTMAAAGFFLCGFAFFAGGRSDVPLWMRQAVQPGETSLKTLVSAPKDAVESVVTARRGFDLTPGATMIRVPVKSAPDTEPTTLAASPRKEPGEQKPPTPSKTTPGLGAATDAAAPGTETVGAVTAAPAPAEHPAAVLPKTHGQRLLAGFVAATIPRFVAQPLGLIEVQGGRGFWILFDMATLMFMSCALIAAAAIFFAVRKSVALRPLVLLTVPTALILGAALFYTVSNFGTLFRQREMVYVALVLIPFAVAAEQGRRRDQDRSADPVQSTLPAETVQS